MLRMDKRMDQSVKVAEEGDLDVWLEENLKVGYQR